MNNNESQANRQQKWLKFTCQNKTNILKQGSLSIRLRYAFNTYKVHDVKVPIVFGREPQREKQKFLLIDGGYDHFLAEEALSCNINLQAQVDCY